MQTLYICMFVCVCFGGWVHCGLSIETVAMCFDIERTHNVLRLFITYTWNHSVYVFHIDIYISYINRHWSHWWIPRSRRETNRSTLFKKKKKNVKENNFNPSLHKLSSSTDSSMFFVDTSSHFIFHWISNLSFLNLSEFQYIITSTSIVLSLRTDMHVVNTLR